MRHFRLILIGAAIAALTACAPAQSATKSADAGTAGEAGQSAAGSGDQAGSEQNASVAKIGGTEGFTYPDGTRVVVASVKPHRFTDYAAGITPGQAGYLVTVTITNGSKEPIDMTLTTVRVSIGANGAQASDVFDETVRPIQGKVAPGRKATGTYGFAVDKADAMGQVTVEVAPGFLNYESALFEGTV